MTRGALDEAWEHAEFGPFVAVEALCAGTGTELDGAGSRLSSVAAPPSTPSAT